MASTGLLLLLLPGQAAPPAIGALMMAVAGIAWGVYTLRGRGSRKPLSDTANNFIFCVPALLLLCGIQTQQLHLDARGVWLALASGGLASGAGYAIWYAALRTLPAIRAAIVQLSVPIVAAGYGVLFMGEPLSARLLISSALVLGGVAGALTARAETASAGRFFPRALSRRVKRG